MSKPKVSVVMPTYKVEKYFRECIESIINQTLTDIEIIPVDDGSPDNCGKIMDEYAAKDSRVKPIHKENGGYGSAVNMGIEAATGEYTGIVETDDFCDPQMFEKLYNRAKELDADVCKCGFNTYNSFDEEKPIRKWQNEIENIETWPCERAYTVLEIPQMMNYHASIWSNIYKREFLIENNIKVNATQGASYQDYPFMVEVMCRAKRIGVIPEYLYNWRLEPEQDSSTKRKGKNLMIMAFQCGEVKRLLKEFGYYDHFKEYMYAHFFHANFSFMVNIEEQYRKEYFEKVRNLYIDIKNDKDFTYSQMSETDVIFIKFILDNKFKQFYEYLSKDVELSWLERIFSLKNSRDGSHKIITVLGVKLKILRTKIFNNKVQN